MDCSTPSLPVLPQLPELPKFMFIAMVMPSSHLLSRPLLLQPSIFHSIRDFSNESAVSTRWPKYWSFRFSISPPVNIQGWSPLRLTGWSPCCPRDFQQSSPAPQFESVNSLAFCLLDSTALTTICDHWEDHSLDYTDLCLSLCGGGDLVAKSYPTLVILWTVACQTPLSMGFSR